MKLISLFVLGVMAVAMSASGQAQTADPRLVQERNLRHGAMSASGQAQTTDPIAKAMLAAPNEALAEEATVVKWNSDFTYEVLRQGTGRMVCYDLSGMPGERPFSVECTSAETNLPRIAQNRKIAAMAGGDEKKREELVAAAAKDGTRVMSEVGSMWYQFRGNDEATAARHTVIAMPNHKGSQIGLPEVRDSGGIWLMQAGTSEAHIMLPGR
jgi:hypothetical protein